jgi:acetylxylan esterase
MPTPKTKGLKISPRAALISIPFQTSLGKMRLLLSFITATVALVSVANAAAGRLQQVTAFKSTPTNAKMYIYIPDQKLEKAPIIVAIHYCNGNAQAYFTFNNNKYATLADTKGYIVIYPSSPASGGCWDVASKASLTHNGGGDSQTIVNMVKYAVENYGGDPDRVFATGTSSGAMMANVLAGAYPDIFKAVTAYSGVPDGCFYVSTAQPGTNSPGWNDACANGQSTKTPQAWGDLVRSYSSGYNGSYPKVMM